MIEQGFQIFLDLRGIVKDDAVHPERVRGFDVLWHIVNKSRFIRLDLGLLQRPLINLRLRLHHPNLRREDEGIEGIIELILDNVIAQVAPRIGNDAGLVARSEANE